MFASECNPSLAFELCKPYIIRQRISSGLAFLSFWGIALCKAYNNVHNREKLMSMCGPYASMCVSLTLSDCSPSSLWPSLHCSPVYHFMRSMCGSLFGILSSIHMPLSVIQSVCVFEIFFSTNLIDSKPTDYELRGSERVRASVSEPVMERAEGERQREMKIGKYLCISQRWCASCALMCCVNVLCIAKMNWYIVGDTPLYVLLESKRVLALTKSVNASQCEPSEAKKSLLFFKEKG